MERYAKIRSKLDLDPVRFDGTAIILFQVEELIEGQLGYSMSPDGESLVGDGEGDWKPSWLVIGYDDLVGDPIFVDLEDIELPTYTAMHGEEAWDPILIASSFQGFVGGLREFARVSVGREYPTAVERNPLPDSERQQVLENVSKVIGEASLEFWELWLTSD